MDGLIFGILRYSSQIHFTVFICSCSSGPRLFLSEVVRPRESQIEGKGVRSQEETSLAFHSPSVLYAKLT